jgi:hypothetical protein
MLPNEITYLLEQAGHLGNHYQKNIQNIRKIFPALAESVKKSGLGKSLKLTKPSRNYHREMTILMGLSDDQRTRLDFLGCYYSMQLLWFNIQNLDWLDYQLSRNVSRQSVYKKFILKSGIQFRQLTAAYMHHLMTILKEDKKIPEFVITGVGTRSDQDDIDVGIVDDGSKGRSWLNQVIHKMSIEMIRFASNFHFHLSEHVGHQAYSASISEYEELLKDKIGNFVILQEMIGSAYIIGNHRLFEEFQKRVTDKYYYHKKPNRYHEGYLRGILGEIIDLSTAPEDPNYIHPKHDGLRIIKNLIYAYKVRLGIDEVNPWRILDVIRKIYPHFKKEFRILEKSLSYIEVFRYIYQQLVVQEELISISDEYIKNNLQQVAHKLHYRDIGPHLGVHQLLQDYTKSIQAFRKILPIFINDLTLHLEKITVFRKIFQRHFPAGGAFKNLLSELRFFESVHFWDDFFVLLQKTFRDYESDLVKDMRKMNAADRSHCMKNVTEWSGSHPEFVFNFCLTFDQQVPFDDFYQFNQLIHYYVDRYKDDPDFLQNLISLFQKKPNLVCRIMQLCSSNTLESLNKILFQKTIRGKRSLYQKNLAELLNLINSCSYYYKRFITNIYQNFPAYACFIQEPKHFQKEENRILKHLPFVKSFDEKIKMLGSYYDINFFHLGLETFRGMEVQAINDHFTHFVNIYIGELFQTCVRKIIKDSRLAQKIASNIMIYACGGNGREQAFDDDFDLIIVTNGSSKEEIDSYREIIAIMNSEMIKRGTLPHFRFSQHFGEYLCPFDGLKDLISSSYPESYIDKSQLLESRLLNGNTEFHQRFLNEIIRKIIFEGTDQYIEQMIREITQRHGSTTFFKEKCANIKECTGGLRDIEMIVLIYKVIYKLLETEPFALIKKFGIRNRKFRDNWLSLKNSLLFLQRFRYVYRLSLTAEDQIYSTGLDVVAKRLNHQLPHDVDPSEWLWNQFIFHRKEAWHAMHQLIRAID